MSICNHIQFKIKKLPHPHILSSVLISSNPTLMLHPSAVLLLLPMGTYYTNPHKI